MVGDATLMLVRRYPVYTRYCGLGSLRRVRNAGVPVFYGDIGAGTGLGRHCRGKPTPHPQRRDRRGQACGIVGLDHHAA